MTQKKQNELIAKYMGWFQQEIQLDGTWFIKGDSSIHVVYSTHNNYPLRDLPFHRDWNHLMSVIDKIILDNNSTTYLIEKPGLNYRCLLKSCSGGVKIFDIWGSGDTPILAVHDAVVKYVTRRI